MIAFLVFGKVIISHLRSIVSHENARVYPLRLSQANVLIWPQWTLGYLALTIKIDWILMLNGAMNYMISLSNLKYQSNETINTHIYWITLHCQLYIRSKLFPCIFTSLDPWCPTLLYMCIWNIVVSYSKPYAQHAAIDGQPS